MSQITFAQTVGEITMQDSEAKVFFRGDYTKRKLALLDQMIGMFLLMAPYLAWQFFREGIQVKHGTAKSLGISVVALLVCWAFSRAGARFWLRAWKGRTWEIVVDSRGVFDGWRFRPWGKIAALGVVGRDDCYTLAIELSGWFGRSYELETEPRLTAEQARALLRALQEEVMPAFPHLCRIGDTPLR